MNSKIRLAVIAASVPLFFCQPQAATIYDSQGFEFPPFVLGPLPGQDPVNGPWQSAGTGGSATVVAGAPGNVTQLVQYDRIDNDSRVGVIKPISNVATSPNGPLINIEWSMSYEDNSTAEEFGPYFAVEAYDEVGGFPLLAASAGIDAKTHEVLYQLPTTGFLWPTGDIVEPNTWADFKLVLDYSNDTYDLFLNGSLILDSVGFVDPGIDGLNDVDLAALGASEADFFASGTGYFDNFRITAGDAAVPDAGGTAIMLLGACALLGISRRR